VSRPGIGLTTLRSLGRGQLQLGADARSLWFDRAGADALLEGAVTRFETTPVQFNAQGRATRVEITVVVRATLRDLAKGTVLWDQSNLVFREQYDVQQTDVNYFDLETTALDTLARGAAQTLVNSITEGF